MFSSIFCKRVVCDESVCHYHQGRCPGGRIWMLVPTCPDPELRLPPGSWRSEGRGQMWSSKATLSHPWCPALSFIFLITIDLVLWIKHCHLLNISLFLIYFFIEGYLLYRIVLFSVKPHESAIGIHISPPFWTSLLSPSPSHPSRLIQSPCWSFLSLTANSR